MNPKGALIGPGGARVRAVMENLGPEKIDIVDYSDDPAKFVAAALSPAVATGVQVISEKNKTAIAFIHDDQLSLAIGKEGQNARLAAKLTGWKIGIESAEPMPRKSPPKRPPRLRPRLLLRKPNRRRARRRMIFRAHYFLIRAASAMARLAASTLSSAMSMLDWRMWAGAVCAKSPTPERGNTIMVAR